MEISKLEEFIYSLFDTAKLNKVKEDGEYGFTNRGKNEIRVIGYATNLTPYTIEKARKKNVDLLITHHDAWGFIHGMKDKCLEELKKSNMSHFYIHLPLDDSDFGTNVTLLKKLGVNTIDKISNDNGFFCGRIGEVDNPIEFSVFVEQIENLLEEPVKAWQNNDRPIKRVGVVTGAGFSTYDVKEAFDKNCDVYITGEKILYTVEYSKLVGINLIVGSHTFTEIFGVESLVNIILDEFDNIEIIKIREEHIE